MPGSASRALRRSLARVAGALLVLLGVAAAAGVVRARRFDGALPELVSDAPLALGADVGDELPFEPFTLVVIGPVRGDHVALERALQKARDVGAALTVIAGDVLPRSPRDLAPLADVVVRQPGAVLLAGPRDVPPVAADERLTALLTPAESFEVRTRGCMVSGEPGVVSLRVLETDRTWTLPVPDGDGATDATVQVQVLDVRAPDRAQRRIVSVARGASVGGVARQLSLAAFWPVGATTTGLVLVLLAALVAAALGLRLAGRRPSDR